MGLSRAKAIYFALVFALTSVASSRCLSYDYGFDVSKLVKRQSPSQVFVVRGATNAKDNIPLRKEIRELEQDQDTWTLYMLALSWMQYTSQDQLLSWYQITGIHGVPFVSWDGVQPTSGNENSGYCEHMSILFPTWHRAYLALYEQILYGLVQTIASLYPAGSVRQQYQSAAADFRIPYWDWATEPPEGESLLPLSVGGSPTVNVSGPNGLQEIANPLFAYQFKPLNPTAFIEEPWSIYPETVRAPTSQTSQAQSNNSLVAMTLDQNQISFRQRLYNLLSNYDNYSTFSNEAWIPDPTNSSYDSIESLHDTIHTQSGLQGHMAYIPFSAFDPIFFLHHCMVDRAVAMWQVLNPDSWVIPTAAVMNSYTTSIGEIQDSKSGLTPFYASTNGSFWNSDMVRDPSVFGYTYLEISGFSSAGKGLHKRSQLIAAINRLYGSSSPASFTTRERLSKRWEDAVKSERMQESRPLSNRGLGQEDDWNITSVAAGRIIVNNQYREWIANICVTKQALNGPFSIQLFLGPAPEDPRTWSYAANLVGTMGIFASPGTYDNGMTAHRVAGTVPLTAALVERVLSGTLANLEPQTVEPFISQELEFRVTLPDATVVEPALVDGLSIGIVSSVVVAPSGEGEFPRWDDTVSHFDLF